MKFFKKYVEMKESNDLIKFFNWLIPYSILMGILSGCAHSFPVIGIVGVLAFIATQFALLDWMK